MLFDITNREAGGCQFSGSRQSRNSTADDENVETRNWRRRHLRTILNGMHAVI